MGRAVVIVGSVVLGLATLGLLVNLRDVKRYVRMSTM
jgi:hypothetical protein